MLASFLGGMTGDLLKPVHFVLAVFATFVVAFLVSFICSWLVMAATSN